MRPPETKPPEIDGDDEMRFPLPGAGAEIGCDAKLHLCSQLMAGMRIKEEDPNHPNHPNHPNLNPRTWTCCTDWYSVVQDKDLTQ